MFRITAIKYFKKAGEFEVIERDSVTGETVKTYGNTLTEKEKGWARSSKECHENRDFVCWMN